MPTFLSGFRMLGVGKDGQVSYFLKKQMLESLTTRLSIGSMKNMKAVLVLLLRRRVVLAIDAFVEIVIWRVPKAVPASGHHFRYRLAYIVADQCVLRYDNERGKGDHRHIGTIKESYVFSTPDQLMADFNADIQRLNHENGHS